MGIRYRDLATTFSIICSPPARALPGSDKLFGLRRARGMVGDRMLEARDVADAVLFLASPLSDLVQGQTPVIGGGASIHV